MYVLKNSITVIAVRISPNTNSAMRTGYDILPAGVMLGLNSGMSARHKSSIVPYITQVKNDTKYVSLNFFTAKQKIINKTPCVK